MAASGAVLTYRELNSRSIQVARLFRSMGLRRGDHIAVMIENSLAFYPVAWAALRSGLYFTPINTRLTAQEALYIIGDCGAKAVVISAKFPQVASELRQSAGDPGWVAFSVGGDLPGHRDLMSEAAQQSDAELEDGSPGASMIYSSGTTGRPKGVKRALDTGAVDGPDMWTQELRKVYGFDENTQYLCPAPIYHGAGFSYTVMMHRLGATAVVMEKFSAEGFLQAVQRWRITHTQVVPTMFVRLLKLSKQAREAFDLSSLRCVIHAAAPCPPEVKEAMLAWLGPIVYEYFAATEGNGYTFITPQEWVAHRGSVGRALVGTPHILDQDGKEQPTGVPGMIYFEGRAPFEYHNDPERTAESRLRGGWSTTGDVGYLDDEGYLYLTDRKAFTIISGGVNIYPQEIENLLTIHPDVMDVAVFGVPDPEFQEQVKAVVQLVDARKAGPVMAQDLIDYCRANLAHYKCPKSIDFMDELPRMENGKLYKRLLRETYWGGHNTRIV